jgi:protein SCO1/2
MPAKKIEKPSSAATPVPSLHTDCSRPASGQHADYFPNIVVRTHERRRALFYEDLLRGKTVLIHFLNIKDGTGDRVAASLREVQSCLADRLGRDVFIYSIAVDTGRDVPELLSAFAERYAAGPGWIFLTADADAIEVLRGALFRGTGHDHGRVDQQDCSNGLIRYGNEAAGVWGSVPMITDPRMIAERIDWVSVREAPTGRPRRRGPNPSAITTASLQPVRGPHGQV